MKITVVDDRAAFDVLPYWMQGMCFECVSREWLQSARFVSRMIRRMASARRRKDIVADVGK